MSSSDITKRALAEALKNLARARSFDRITIADICEACGVNRQTFYYHFSDKFALVTWIFERELIREFRENLTFENWDKKLCKLLETMKASRHFYQGVLTQSAFPWFQDDLFRSTRGLLLEIVTRVDENSAMRTDGINLLVDFYTYGVVGLILQWARTGMGDEPNILILKIQSLIIESRQFTLELFSALEKGEH